MKRPQINMVPMIDVLLLLVLVLIVGTSTLVEEERRFQTFEESPSCLILVHGDGSYQFLEKRYDLAGLLAALEEKDVSKEVLGICSDEEAPYGLARRLLVRLKRQYNTVLMFHEEE